MLFFGQNITDENTYLPGWESLSMRQFWLFSLSSSSLLTAVDLHNSQDKRGEREEEEEEEEEEEDQENHQHHYNHHAFSSQEGVEGVAKYGRNLSEDRLIHGGSCWVIDTSGTLHRVSMNEFFWGT